MTEATEVRSTPISQDILAAVGPLGGLDLTLSDAHGCVLVEDVHSTFPLPPFDNAAMDGYAVRAEDVRRRDCGDAGRLPVVGDVAAGKHHAVHRAAGVVRADHDRRADAARR